MPAHPESTAGLAIRHLEADDYAAVIPLVDAWWGGRRMRDMLPRLFFVHFKPTSFAAELDGRLAGFLCGLVSQTDPGVAYVHFVGVDPAARCAGVGRALYDRFFAAARAAGCREAQAVTSPANERSRAFHRRIGFVEVAPPGGGAVWVGYDGPGEDRVRFRYDLTAGKRDAAPN
jgi:ribosomal protein S18 acetylase RimI-like enzyme